MSTRSNRRRRWLVNKPLQSRIVFQVSWPGALALVIVAAVLGLLCYRLANEALEAQITLPSLLPLFGTVAAFLLVALGYMFANALRFSHRVAGPIYRLNRTLKQVQEGDLSARANLRQGDFLAEVADGVNEFLEWLEEHPPAVGEAAEAGEERVEREAAVAAESR